MRNLTVIRINTIDVRLVFSGQNKTELHENSKTSIYYGGLEKVNNRVPCVCGPLLYGATEYNLVIIKVCYSPTDARVSCFTNSFKIDIKIDIKTAPTGFGAVTSSGSALFELAKVTVVKIIN
jgi:hypothetical protein